MKKYISYRRVSTKRQGKSGLGLESQSDIIRHFFPNIEQDFVEVKSGSSIKNRPELRKAIEYCHKSGAYMVVAKVDRLARNALEGLQVYEELKGRVIFCDLPQGDDIKLMITIYFAFAERERELISARIKGALNRAKARGQKLGVHNKVGKRQPFTGQVSRKGADARREQASNRDEVVRAWNFAKALRGSGLTFDDIAKQLNITRYETPTKGKKWSKGTVWRLLNKKYKIN